MTRGRLDVNPEPIRVVPVRSWPTERGLPWQPRCHHEDGRGQCRALATVVRWNPSTRGVERYCARHDPGRLPG